MARAELTASMQDYLKEIFHLNEEEGEVSTVSLAARLGVAAPSVTSMVKRLDDLGLVRHSPYREIELTPAGHILAIEVVRHHRLIELYLNEFLDVPWEQVHDEAERLEHVISEDLETRMAEKLGQPDFDPHGDPIPSHEGRVPDQAPSMSLWDVPAGAEVEVARVSDRDPGLLAYLASLQLIPGATLTIVESSHYAGTVALEIQGKKHIIGSDLAKSIRVRPVLTPAVQSEEQQ